MPDRNDLSLLEETARAAGALALEFQTSGLKHWRKDDRSPVSDADLAVDNLINRALTSARPDYGWLSEESEPDRTKKDRVFVIDPIDGTRAYIAGRDTWTVSLAIIEDHRPIAGVVYNPTRNEMYAASLDAKTTLNGTPVEVSNHSALAGATLAGGEGVYSRASFISNLKPKPVFIGATSMAYRLCLVASGHCDATISLSGKSDWDIAAGLLLVHQAGGHVTDIAGQTIKIGENSRHETVIAANPVLHAAAQNHFEIESAET
ncbi:MAG: 3'(2'),5'-bisphosphate nucleotidase CysQ [Pseudomonadota bacterium]